MPEPGTSISVELGAAGGDYTVDELWPDGDAPKVVTADDVADRLAGALSVTIHVNAPNPAWNPTPPLIPEHAPKRRVVTFRDIAVPT